MQLTRKKCLSHWNNVNNPIQVHFYTRCKMTGVMYIEGYLLEKLQFRWYHMTQDFTRKTVFLFVFSWYSTIEIETTFHGSKTYKKALKTIFLQTADSFELQVYIQKQNDKMGRRDDLLYDQLLLNICIALAKGTQQK